MNDEAHFYLNGFIYKQNSRNMVYILLFHFFLWKIRLILTINTVQYCTKFINFVRPAVANNPQMWFQQDEVTAQQVRETVALLRAFFGELINPRRSDFNWSPHSFVWAYLKERVYVNKLRTFLELKTKICNTIRAPTRDISQKQWKIFWKSTT